MSVSGGAVCHELRSADGERQAPGAGAPRAALRAALRTAGAGGSVAAMPAIRYLDSNVPASFKYAGLAPVAQLDRALPSEGRGQRFESFGRANAFNDFLIYAQISRCSGKHRVSTAAWQPLDAISGDTGRGRLLILQQR